MSHEQLIYFVDRIVIPSILCVKFKDENMSKMFSYDSSPQPVTYNYIPIGNYNRVNNVVPYIHLCPPY